MKIRSLTTLVSKAVSSSVRSGPEMRVTAVTLAGKFDRLPQSALTQLRQRLSTVLSTLDSKCVGGDDTATLLRDLEYRLESAEPAELWLTLAVLDARLPDLTRVQRVSRRASLDGALVALHAEVFERWLEHPGLSLRRAVEVVSNQVVVDIHHATRTELSTGIQRVTREMGRRWQRDHDPIFVNWHVDEPALCSLTAKEASDALIDARVVTDSEGTSRPVLVPWRSTYVLAELHSDVERAEYLHAMLRYSGNSAGAIGFDCVPLTSAETIREGMGNGFAAGLAALAHADRIACISMGAKVEYDGWRMMLTGAGLTGPDTRAILLPAQAQLPSSGALQSARDRFVLGSMPLVLCVGSHEPRKNHLALLHAAELVWRRGIAFSLAFVGGSGWNGERFEQRVRELQDAGRALQSERAFPDDELWAAYRLARFTIFPSLNEGFGLPVAESLAAGTPVITSNFGSMAEIAADGGALLVDPRDDHAIADAMVSLLQDDQLHARLVSEARERPERTWDHYAAEVWTYLVEGA